MEISENCIKLLKHYEGCRLQAYRCSAGIWTIGYGNTYYEDGRPVRRGDIISPADAERLLQIILRKYVRVIDDCRIKPEQWELDALVSFVYNVGAVTFRSSTLIKKIRSGVPAKEVAAEFHRWNKTKGKVLAGLTKRRAAEAYLFEFGELKIF